MPLCRWRAMLNGAWRKVPRMAILVFNFALCNNVEAAREGANMVTAAATSVPIIFFSETKKMKQ